MKYLVSTAILVIGLSTTLLQAQTIKWEDSLSQATVYLHIDVEDFKEHPHRSSAAYDVIETPAEFHETILSITNKTLRKYPSDVLNRHVEKLYLYDQFDKGNDLMGVYRGKHGFLFAIPYLDNGHVDTLDLERVIHHEISHRLQMFEGKGFDLKSWKENNTLKYGEIKSYDRDFAPDLYDKGFINQYAVMNKFEDFAAFAENIFINKPAFWNAIDSHNALRNKFEIICAYYESLDPSMNRDYFLEMNGVTLSP